jgi:hypothetical protein
MLNNSTALVSQRDSTFSLWNENINMHTQRQQENEVVRETCQQVLGLQKRQDKDWISTNTQYMVVKGGNQKATFNKSHAKQGEQQRRHSTNRNNQQSRRAHTRANVATSMPWQKKRYWEAEIYRACT